jgi:tripartite-type tricarboxylate transporter receptor subunit TctC
MTGLDLVRVPYTSSYFPDLLAGQVQVSFATVPSAIEFVRAGKLRPLAVTGRTRSRILPDLPTVGEFVPGYEADAWNGVGAPTSTPPEIIDKLNKEIDAVLADPAMQAHLTKIGSEPLSMTPAEFGEFIANETGKWANVSLPASSPNEDASGRVSNTSALHRTSSATPFCERAMGGP